MTLIPQSRLKDPATQLTLNERIKIFQTEFPNSRLMIKEFPTGTASVNNIRSLLTQIQNYEEFYSRCIDCRLLRASEICS